MDLMTKITIHTPSAGVRAISINGTASQYVIRTEKLAGKPLHRLIDTTHQFGLDLGASHNVRSLEFTLRDHLLTIS